MLTILGFISSIVLYVIGIKIMLEGTSNLPQFIAAFIGHQVFTIFLWKYAEDFYKSLKQKNSKEKELAS